jgi:hypothetical protein
MGKHKATFQKHLSHITETQFVTESPQNDEEDDVCGNLKRVERRASSFVEGTVTPRTEKVAQPSSVFFVRFLLGETGQ